MYLISSYYCISVLQITNTVCLEILFYFREFLTTIHRIQFLVDETKKSELNHNTTSLSQLEISSSIYFQVISLEIIFPSLSDMLCTIFIISYINVLQIIIDALNLILLGSDRIQLCSNTYGYDRY